MNFRRFKHIYKKRHGRKAFAEYHRANIFFFLISYFGDPYPFKYKKLNSYAYIYLSTIVSFPK